MKYIVITGHKSNYPNPIEFHIGDKVTIGEMDTEFEGWIRTTTSNGNVGWAPIQYIDFDVSSAVGTANQDYSARELDTVVGERVILICELNEWCLVRNQDGLVGWVPAQTLATV
ncbi:hypothetical protein GCM10007938_06310 [Vibrio zhanjiangensis]|uniref:SH3 domain-containing protein n=1 Tax=Vibrio zhanjiangensis TaxID=1046128 RepID=A0ABQ6EV41_9VIBR|nr:SH3 domain-containing protein [Vibrio zhanjiangensis]GLT16854.1 hypothetical protein GCM10007938_06310 [Vibrio zhanjiangensis]